MQYGSDEEEAVCFDSLVAGSSQTLSETVIVKVTVPLQTKPKHSTGKQSTGKQGRAEQRSLKSNYLSSKQDSE